MINPCFECDFYDSDFGCTCPSYDMWYVCPLQSEPTEEDFKEYANLE